MYIVAGIIVVIVVFLSVGYVKSPPNTATIISGPGKHPRVLIGKAGFKIRRGFISKHLLKYDKFPYGKPQTDEVARGSGTESMAVRD